MKVLFIDDRLDEIIRQWECSDCENDHELLPLEPFDSIERTCQMVQDFKPDVVFVGYGLGKFNITGADVIRAIREQGYTGYIFANSGGGINQFEKDGVRVDGSVNRNPSQLKLALDKLTERNER